MRVATAWLAWGAQKPVPHRNKLIARALVGKFLPLTDLQGGGNHEDKKVLQRSQWPLSTKTIPTKLPVSTRENARQVWSHEIEGESFSVGAPVLGSGIRSGDAALLFALGDLDRAPLTLP